MISASNSSAKDFTPLSQNAASKERKGPGFGRALAILFLLIGIGLLFGSAGVQWQIRSVVRGNLYSSVDEAPERSVALVFGAGLRRGGQPSPILQDRLETAVELYKAGKVKKLLMTGDNGSLYYNEVAAMRKFAMNMGVPSKDIVKDHAGFRTYDSCYRARDVFEVKDAILVTQEFHLPRAVYLARTMGIDAVGVSADRHPYARMGTYQWREWLAQNWSWVEMNVTHPRPRFLGPKLPVFDQIASTEQSYQF